MINEFYPSNNYKKKIHIEKPHHSLYHKATPESIYFETQKRMYHLLLTHVN